MIKSKEYRQRYRGSFRLRRRIFTQKINTRVIFSGALFVDLTGRHDIQRLFLNKEDEHVLLNSLDVTFRRLRRSCIIFLGTPSMKPDNRDIRHFNWIFGFQSFIENELELEYDSQVKFQVIYEKSNEEVVQSLRSKIQGYTFNWHPIQGSDGWENAFTNIVEQIRRVQESQRFPSFTEISNRPEDNQKLTIQRSAIYSIFSGMNFKQARKDLVSFYEYMRDNQIRFSNWDYKDIDSIDFLIQHYKAEAYSQTYRKCQTIIMNYSTRKCFYSIINMCLRSLLDPRDLAYVRLLFYDLFMSVAELFTRQQPQRKLCTFQKQFKVYRGCNLSQKQIRRVKELVGKFIQMDGFLSASLSKQAAIGFIKKNTNVPVLIEITLPYIEKSNNIFHSFAFIQQYSAYQYEQEILFNSLNTFKVVEVTPMEEGYKLDLEYVDVMKLIKQCKINSEFKEKLSEAEKGLISNYQFHEWQLILNRTQGEVLWRTENISIAQYFFATFLGKLLNTEKVKAKYQTSVECKPFKTFDVRQLYIELKNFVPEFEWYLDEGQNVRLVSLLVKNNQDKALQIFFYTGKTFESLLCYERSLIYLVTYFDAIYQLYAIKSESVWIAASNIGAILMNLGKIKQSKMVYDWCFQMLKMNTNIKPTYTNYLLYIQLMATYFVDGQMEMLNSVKAQALEKFRQIKQGDIPNTIWLELIQNFPNINSIVRFEDFYSKKLANPPEFLIHLLILLIEHFSTLLQLSRKNMTPDQIRQKEHELAKAVRCLQNIQKKKPKKCVNILAQVMSLQYQGYAMEKTQHLLKLQKCILETEISKMYCYELQLHTSTLKHFLRTCLRDKVKPHKKIVGHLIQLAKVTKQSIIRYGTSMQDGYFAAVEAFCVLVTQLKKKLFPDNKQAACNQVGKQQALRLFLKVIKFKRK